MSFPPALATPATARDAAWRRSALVITLLLTTIAAAVAVLFISAAQLTERSTAQRFLAAAVSSLLEVDAYLVTAWPALETAAADGQPIPLSGFPVRLQLDPAGVADGPDAIARDIAAATASLLYDDGLNLLADTPQSFRLVSRGAAFDGTIGRLTRGGHQIATIALIVSGTLTILLALAAAAQTRGAARFGAPALALAVGAGLVLLIAALLQASFAGRADGALDPFSADLWRLAADALALLARNAAVTAAAAGVVVGAALAAELFLRAHERPLAPGR